MKALFITLQDLKRKSIIDGNVDGDKLIQFIEVAQDTHIQNYLGGKLYEKLQDLIISGDIDLVGNAKYKTLIETYIKPMLVWYTQAAYLPFAAFQISNGGVFRHRSENSDLATSEEIKDMLNRVNSTADFYTRRFQDYMGFYSQDYPEYNTSTNGEMYPDQSYNFSSWVL